MRSHRSIDALVRPINGPQGVVADGVQASFGTFIEEGLRRLETEFDDLFSYGFEWRVLSDLADELGFRWQISFPDGDSESVEKQVHGSGWVKVFIVDPTGRAAERYPREPDLDESLGEDAWDAAWLASDFGAAEARSDEWTAKVLALLESAVADVLGSAEFELEPLGWPVSIPVTMVSEDVIGFDPPDDRLHVLARRTPVWVDVSSPDHYRALVDLAWKVDANGWDRRDTIICTLEAPREGSHEPSSVSVVLGGVTLGLLSEADSALYGPAIAKLTDIQHKKVGVNGAIVAADRMRNRRWNATPQTAGARLAALGSLGFTIYVDLEELGIAYQEQTRMGGLASARFLLETASKPEERHLAYDRYENALKTAASDVPWALDELETIAELHYAELPEMRPGLLAYRGSLPDMRVFELMSANAAKRQDWQTSLTWAERGMDFYGSDALFRQSVEQLERRAAKARKQLHISPPVGSRSVEPDGLADRPRGRDFGPWPEGVSDITWKDAATLRATYDGLVERFRSPSAERAAAVAGLAVSTWLAEPPFSAEGIMETEKMRSPEEYREAGLAILPLIEAEPPSGLVDFAEAHLARAHEMCKELKSAERVWRSSWGRGSRHPLFINRYSYRLEREGAFDASINVIDHGLQVRQEWRLEQMLWQRRVRCQEKAGLAVDPHPPFRVRQNPEHISVETVEQIPQGAVGYERPFPWGRTIHDDPGETIDGWGWRVDKSNVDFSPEFTLRLLDPQGTVVHSEVVDHRTKGPVRLGDNWLLGDMTGTWAVTPSGDTAWTCDVSFTGPPIVASDRALGVAAGTLYAIDADGTVRAFVGGPSGMDEVRGAIRDTVYVEAMQFGSPRRLIAVPLGDPTDHYELCTVDDVVEILHDDSWLSWSKAETKRSGVVTHEARDGVLFQSALPTLARRAETLGVMEDQVHGLSMIGSDIYVWGQTRVVLIGPAFAPSVLDFRGYIDEVFVTDRGIVVTTSVLDRGMIYEGPFEITAV